MMGLAGNTCVETPSTGKPVKVNPEKPIVGTLFNDTKEVHAFYTNYVRSEGLGIVRRSSNLGLDGKVEVFHIGMFTRRKWLQYLEE